MARHCLTRNASSEILGGLDKLEALRAIMFVNQRAMFEFALSKNSLVEVSDKGNLVTCAAPTMY